MSVRLGALTARDALRASRYLILALAGVVVVSARGALERTSDATGADHTLLGLTLTLVVPLASYGLFESVLRRRRTSDLFAPLARHGADRHALASGALLVLAAISTFTTALFAALAVVSSASSRPGLAADAWAAAWGGALTGGAYAGLFAFGSRWGRAGRLWLLALDFNFGLGTGVLALPSPHAKTRNLLGGAAVLETSPTFAAAALAAIGALGLFFGARRGPR